MTVLGRIVAASPVTAENPVLAFYRGEAGFAFITSGLSGPDLGNVVMTEGGIEVAIKVMRRGERPAVVIYDVGNGDDATRDIEMLAKHGGRTLPIIAIGGPIELSRYRQILAAGAFDYAECTPNGSMLAEIVATAKCRRLQQPVEAGPARSGKVILFCGSRGGVGTTSCAIATAWSLAQQHAIKTVLLDLDLTQGTVAFALDIDPGRGLREVMEQPARIDAMFIERSLVRAGARLAILSGEEAYDAAIETDPAAVTTLIDELKQNFECIVVDLPRGAAVLQRAALAAADDIVLIAAPSLAGLRDAIRLADFCAGAASSAVLKVILGPSAGGPSLPTAEFEKALGRKVEMVVPFDTGAAVAAANAGQSIIEASATSAVGRALATIPVILGYAVAAERSVRRLPALRWPWSAKP